MHRSDITIILIGVLVLAGSVAFAEPWRFACAGTLQRTVKLQEDITAQHQEVRQAERRVREANAALVACGPGLFSVNRLQACNRARENLPVQVKALTLAEEILEGSIQQFRKELLGVPRVCVEN